MQPVLDFLKLSLRNFTFQTRPKRNRILASSDMQMDSHHCAPCLIKNLLLYKSYLRWLPGERRGSRSTALLHYILRLRSDWIGQKSKNGSYLFEKEMEGRGDSCSRIASSAAAPPIPFILSKRRNQIKPKKALLLNNYLS